MSLVFLNFFSPRVVPNGWNHSTRAKQPAQARLAPTAGVPSSTDLRCFKGKRLLCVLDGDNVDYSLKRQGLRFRYPELLRRLNTLANPVFSLVVLTNAPDDNRREAQLTAEGWRVISVPWETVTTCRGVEKRANADLDIAFEIGSLGSIGGCDAALIGTGDGDLATSCAAGLRRTHRRGGIRIHALSVAGASSARLRQRTDLFDSNLIIGRDLLASAIAANKCSYGDTLQGVHHGS